MLKKRQQDLQYVRKPSSLSCSFDEGLSDSPLSENEVNLMRKFEPLQEYNLMPNFANQFGNQQNDWNDQYGNQNQITLNFDEGGEILMQSDNKEQYSSPDYALHALKTDQRSCNKGQQINQSSRQQNICMQSKEPFCKSQRSVQINSDTLREKLSFDTYKKLKQQEKQVATQLESKDKISKTICKENQENIFNRLYLESKYKKQVKEAISNYKCPEKEKVISQQEQQNLYKRLMEYQMKKEEKILQQRRIQEYQKELELIELSNNKNNTLHKDSSITNLVTRMQSDIQKRKNNKEQKKLQKQIQEKKEAMTLFTPQINRNNQIQSARASVFERMQSDVQRRGQSLAQKIALKEINDEQITNSHSRSKSISRLSRGNMTERSVSIRPKSFIGKEFLTMDSNKTPQKQNTGKIRNALCNGASAMELWKQIENNNQSPNQDQLLVSIDNTTFPHKQQNMSAYKKISCVEQRICPSVQELYLYETAQKFKESQQFEYDNKQISNKINHSSKQINHKKSDQKNSKNNQYMIESEAEKLVQDVWIKYNQEKYANNSSIYTYPSSQNQSSYSSINQIQQRQQVNNKSQSTQHSQQKSQYSQGNSKKLQSNMNQMISFNTIDIINNVASTLKINNQI